MTLFSSPTDFYSHRTRLVLAEKNINIQVISTSEIKVSVLIGADYTELAVRALHSAFDLDAVAEPA